MRYVLKQTNGRSFELSIPDKHGRARMLGFDYITELDGAVEVASKLLGVDGASAREFQVVVADWHAGSVHLGIGGPILVQGLMVDGCIPLSGGQKDKLGGRAKLALLSADSLVLQGVGAESPNGAVDGDDEHTGADGDGAARGETGDSGKRAPFPRITSTLRIEELSLEHEAGAGRLALKALAVRDLQTTIGDAVVRVKGVGAQNVNVSWQEGRPAVEIDALTIDQIEVAGSAVDITVEDIAARRLRRDEDGHVHAEVLEWGKISVVFHIPERKGESIAAQPPRGPLKLPVDIDLRLLDRLDGHVEVDVTLDASLPVLGRRKATHQFRVPINRGVINYRQVERGLATLEDAVIDFDVRGHKLVIERDLPIVRLRKNLVEWHLDAEEMALARQRQVRLRTLPHFEIVSSSGNSDIKVRSIQFGHIDIALSATGPVTPSSDSADREELSQSGEMAAAGETPAAAIESEAKDAAAGDEVSSAACEPPPDAGGDTGGDSDGDAEADGDKRAAEPDDSLLDGIIPDMSLAELAVTGTLNHPEGEGAIALTLRQLALGLRGLAVAGYRIDMDGFVVEAVGPATMSFDALRPRSLSATVRGVRMRQLRLATPKPPVDGE